VRQLGTPLPHARLGRRHPGAAIDPAGERAFPAKANGRSGCRQEDDSDGEKAFQHQGVSPESLVGDILADRRLGCKNPAQAVHEIVCSIT
jgi:hypothetical protein